jgi:alkyl hydroperoxide reductase subunit AhpC
LVDFAVNGGPIRSRGIKIAAASVDSVEATAKLKEGLHVGYPVYAELDAHKVAEDTGAHIQTGDRTFMHATCFIVKPDGTVAAASYASGPLGRMWAHEVLRSVQFQMDMAAKG